MRIVCKIERSNWNWKKIPSFAQKSDVIKKAQMANANRYPSVTNGLADFTVVFLKTFFDSFQIMPKAVADLYGQILDSSSLSVQFY